MMADIVERLRTLGNAPFLEEAAEEIEQLRTMLEQCRFLLTMLHPDHHGEMSNAEIASLFGATLNMLEERT